MALIYENTKEIEKLEDIASEGLTKLSAAFNAYNALGLDASITDLSEFLEIAKAPKEKIVDRFLDDALATSPTLGGLPVNRQQLKQSVSLPEEDINTFVAALTAWEGHYNRTSYPFGWFDIVDNAVVRDNTVINAAKDEHRVYTETPEEDARLAELQAFADEVNRLAGVYGKHLFNAGETSKVKIPLLVGGFYQDYPAHGGAAGAPAFEGEFKPNWKIIKNPAVYNPA